MGKLGHCGLASARKGGALHIRAQAYTKSAPLLYQTGPKYLRNKLAPLHRKVFSSLV